MKHVEHLPQSTNWSDNLWRRQITQRIRWLLLKINGAGTTAFNVATSSIKIFTSTKFVYTFVLFY